MDWQENNNVLEKNFTFESFTQAIDFVNKVAKVAEKLHHHPEIFIHDYNQVRIQTFTHSEGKITQKDHNLAQQIDSL